MFNVGDQIIYSVHGLCEIDEICEKTFGNKTGIYYVLHPLEDSRLTINVPIDSEQAVMLKVMGREEAEDILQSFQQPGITWIEDPRQRKKEYSNLINTGDRKLIVKVANTLLKKHHDANENKKRLYDQDRTLLTNIQNIMYEELAVSLDTSVGEISKRVTSMVIKND
ncbi:CarD family transcriptional regulator [Oceanobacillus sp. 143]|uniref:CarD family transcriptional regulator n=1 Tax=Oceanobacillus zhaokaii TaxID=2052660 RepID=A0A345PCN4_9BACI|nr:CarD family transcriptional regulator [Oceanobacillus zhaokaii]AXI07764.1 CarD family transcriptional regulator [Oceanobacillus zhaokaii]QGS67907.1 CarD family transcriptional regulator [Oceanobacillus sp. 143]